MRTEESGSKSLRIMNSVDTARNTVRYGSLERAFNVALAFCSATLRCLNKKLSKKKVISENDDLDPDPLNAARTGYTNKDIHFEN